jgi:hypothetical protein
MVTILRGETFMTTLREFLFASFACLFSAVPLQGAISPADAEGIAIDTYIYGYPLVTMELTRQISTNVAEAGSTQGAPMGQFFNLREYPSPSFTKVTTPNADTLYSTAWLDVSHEPYILSIPDVSDRYYLMPMLSGWTDVFQSPGTRTTGTKAQKYAITGPNWSGTLPEGVVEYKSPTALVWIIGRTYCTGTPEDYKAVHAIQDQYTLVPLSAYGKSYIPPKGVVDPSVDMNTPVKDQISNMDTAAFFQLLAKLMKDNPPAKADAPIVERMAQIGIVPGEEFSISKLDSAVAERLKGVPKLALEKIEAHFDKFGKQVNGWTVFTDTGTYGTEYLNRALVTLIGLGANLPQDAVYPTSKTDANGKLYSGKNKYTFHFEKGQFPPVNGFWSLTMYNAKMFFIENPLNRYTLSQRNRFNENSDGSVTLYIQNENPGKDKEANWLPAPEGEFVLILRLYWPKEQSPSILNGTWAPPAVK